MAVPETASFAQYVLMIESLVTPGTYVPYCGLLERAIIITPEYNEVSVPDCDDEDKPAWVEREAASYSAEISGEGVLVVAVADRIEDALFTGSKLKVRLVLRSRATPTTWTEVKHYAGIFVVGALSNAATKGERVTRTINMLSSGPVTKVLPA